MPRLAKLCVCSLNLTGSSAFHPIHLKEGGSFPSAGKALSAWLRGPVALALVWTARPDPGVRMT